jgi:hypothetical protein
MVGSRAEAVELLSAAAGTFLAAAVVSVSAIILDEAASPSIQIKLPIGGQRLLPGHEIPARIGKKCLRESSSVRSPADIVD